MAKRDFPTPLSFPLTIVFFGVFIYIIGFGWGVLVLGPLAALATDWLIGYLMGNKWDALAGSWPWARTYVGHLVGDGRYWGLVLRNPVSLPEQATVDLLKPMGLDIEELKKSFSIEGRRVMDVSTQALPTPDGGQPNETLINSKGEGSVGQLEIPSGPGEQRGIQMQAPAEKEEAIELSLETIVGVNPRKRPRHRVIVCVKLESTPLAGTSFCGQGRTRHGRMWWHGLMPNAMDFGTKYAPGFGYYRLYMAMPVLTNIVPPYFRNWLERMAEQGTLIHDQIQTLNLELKKLKAESDRASFWKNLYKDVLTENDKLYRQMELVKRSLARANLPLGIEWMESLRPKTEGFKRGLGHLNLLRFAIIAGAAISAWTAYAFVLQNPYLMVYGMYMPYLVAGLIFGGIIFLCRKRLEV